ncbi:MAG: TonB-dependent receptor [Alistipes sp.]
MKQIPLLLLLALTSISAFAQKVELSGIIVDDKDSPVPFCNVVIKQLSDSTYVAGCATDLEGKWRLKTVEGAYWLSVSYIGYEDYFDDVTIDSNKQLDKIVLRESSVNLDELVIVARRNVQQANSNTYYLSDSPKTLGRNALEVVSMAAGVSSDTNKGLRIYGKDGVRVMINNRMIEMTGPQLASYIANIKGEDIASVEVMSTANATFDANATGGVIKIKLKSRSSDGYGLSAGIKGTMFGSDFKGVNPDVAFNVKTGKISLYGNLAFNSTGWNRRFTEQTDYLGRSETIQTQTKINYSSTIRNWFGRLGMVYTFNDNHSLGLDFDGTLHRDTERANSPSTVTTQGITTRYQAGYITPDTIRKGNLSLDYNWKTDSKGSNLNVGMSYYYSGNTTTEDNTLRDLANESNPVKLYYSHAKYSQNMYTAGLGYKWIVNSEFAMNFGVKYNRTKLSNKQKAYDKESGDWTVDKENTDNYKYVEQVIAGYVNGTYKTDKWAFDIGVRYEQTLGNTRSDNFAERNQKNTLHDFFPMASATYTFNKEKGHHLTLKAHSGIKRPSFDELIPYSTQQSLYSYITGNPYLKPSYNYSVGLDLLLFDAFYWGVNFSRDKNNIELMMEPREVGSLILDAKYGNVPKVTTYQTMAYIPVPIGKVFYIGFELSAARKNRDLAPLKESLWQFHAAFDSEITLPRAWAIELTGNYVNKEFYGNSILRNYYTFDCAVKKSFLDKRLQVALSGVNVFGRKKELEMVNGAFRREVTMLDSAEGRCFMFSVRYAFNSNSKVKEKRVRNINSDERLRDSF